MSDDLRAFTIAQAADLLSASQATIRRLVRLGELRVVRIGADPRIPASEIARFLDVDREDDR